MDSKRVPSQILKNPLRSAFCRLDGLERGLMSTPMQMDRFTIKAQEALQQAQAIAQRYSHQQIDGEHLMLALLEQAEGLIHPLLQKLGAAPAALTTDLNRELERRAKVQGTTSSDVFL